MTVTVQQVANTNSFDFWVKRTNELSTAMTNVVVTTDSNTAVGNAAITGKFSANVVYVANVVVGNSTVNTTFTTPNTVQISDANYYLNANGSWSKVASELQTSIATTGTTSQILDAWPFTKYRGAEYLVRVSGTVVNAHQTSKLLTIHNNSVGQVTEYGTLTTNNSIAVFSATANATHFILNVTPTLTATTINLIRNGL